LPPDGRAWGGVFFSAKRKQLIIDDQGYAPMKDKKVPHEPETGVAIVDPRGGASSTKS
jgi:hypothetical protein